MSGFGVLENSFIQYVYKREVETYDLEPFGEEDNYEIILELHILNSNCYNASFSLSSIPDYKFKKEMTICGLNTREEALLEAEKEILNLIKQHKKNN